MIGAALLWSAVAILGGIGAIARFKLDGFVQQRLDTEFPSGTFAVNGLGSFLLGLLVGLDVGGDALLLGGVAALGSFTTFSTWMLETQRLAEDGEAELALTNVTASIVLGIALAGLGWWIGGVL